MLSIASVRLVVAVLTPVPDALDTAVLTSRLDELQVHPHRSPRGFRSLQRVNFGAFVETTWFARGQRLY